MNVTSNTGEKFRQIADKLFGGKVGDLAKALGMHPGSFSKYTSGKTMPGGRILRKLIALDININWFLADIPPMLISDTDVNTESGRIEAGVSEEEVSSTYPKDKSSTRGTNYFTHINEEDLNQAETRLLEEVKQFSSFLETRRLHPHAKRIFLEQLILSIDQEVERRQL